ncbi:MAG: DUF4861 family protein [Candidatus Cyclobacteriaceae bacterium M3_2C_046]
MKNLSFIHISISLLISLCVIGDINGQKKEQLETSKIAEKVLNKGLAEIDLGLYPGTLLMHGISEYALRQSDERMLKRTIDLFLKYKTGEIEGRGSFISYQAGGSGAAYLVYKDVAPELTVQVKDAAQRMYEEQKRSSEGILIPHWSKEGMDRIFIDVAFAVTPYLLYSGLAFNNQQYVDLAVFETLELFKILRDEKTGLVKQARGFSGYGEFSEDNWSRGNGWGAFALAILARDLPEDHPDKKDVDALAKSFFTAIINYQDQEGLWHQEMTAPQSYIETSGSGLLLYGLGIMLEKGLINQRYRKNFEKGIEEYISYIGKDGSISHTCSGCLSPGPGKRGNKEDYINHPWIYNDHHAFGPAVLSFTQANKIGIDEIEGKMGEYTITGSPFTPKSYLKNIEGRSITWENDRIAYRLFGPDVRNEVGSGIDIWVKSVDYPIVDKWYKLNVEGKNYHTDRGEGYDFYDMGKYRGCGGLAIWHENKPYVSETYSNFKIIKNQDDAVVFDVQYEPWKVNGFEVSEKKQIEMVKGTNLFKVTSTLYSDHQEDLKVAIGLTTFGNPKLDKNENKAFLSNWEQIEEGNGHLGSAVIVDPGNVIKFVADANNHYVLIKVKPNQPFTYYAGAGWSKSKYFDKKEDWSNYIYKEASKANFNN